MSTPLQYRLRIRTTADDADYLVITSVPGGTNPYIAEPPEGDGATLDPVAGSVSVGAYTVRVIDAVATVPGVDAATTVTEGFEYATSGAMTTAGWTLTDTLGTGSITVGATDQVDAGTYSLKMATTGSGALAGSGVLRATRTFDTGDGLVAGTTYRVTVRGRMDARDWFDVQSTLRVTGVDGTVEAAITTSGA